MKEEKNSAAAQHCSEFKPKYGQLISTRRVFDKSALKPLPTNSREKGDTDEEAADDALHFCFGRTGTSREIAECF